ncbi:Plant intracellular Ras-group-related LRR protein 7 [Ananas comosus]|uniref:Plant intracellular Ras-group-related LRR protein 7 n=1 Tax=Ananas comosus TaxID=4615 RepID=A0A199UX31_ANACO|nr:Plant intracellular Ras-group-related LRR protein 7 [Ananas comosus]
MGCCSSKSIDSRANRIARWRSTGIVALRDGKLKTLPDELFQVDKFVRTLDLTNNKIAEIPPEIDRLLTLQRLVLAGNLLEFLPANIGNLRNLKAITLDGNRMSVLPDECNFLSLLLLNVSNNKLKSLPESIGDCISLEELQANGNSIDDLPSSICNLIHLKSLLLNNNNIRQLPQNLLKECKSLQNISLHDNPISMDRFQQMEGFDEFEGRRKKKFDKQIDSNVMMSSTALDEGLDLR